MNLPGQIIRVPLIAHLFQNKNIRACGQQALGSHYGLALGEIAENSNKWVSTQKSRSASHGTAFFSLRLMLRA
jgi:hypothetical protein